MNLRPQLNSLLRKFGWNLSHFTWRDHPLAKRIWLMDLYNVDLVLDVGANTGQYARQIREELDYQGRIISFEPLSKAYSSLEAASVHDPLWECHNYALGDNNENTVINVSGNSY